MTKILRSVVILVVLSQGLIHAQLPGVDQVLQRFVSALGGEKELETIRTMTLRGTIGLPDFKANGKTVEYFKYPDHFVAVTDIEGRGSTKLIYDGREGWQVDPQKWTRKLSEVRFNEPIDDSVFLKPERNGSKIITPETRAGSCRP